MVGTIESCGFLRISMLCNVISFVSASLETYSGNNCGFKNKNHNIELYSQPAFNRSDLHLCLGEVMIFNCKLPSFLYYTVLVHPIHQSERKQISYCTWANHTHHHIIPVQWVITLKVVNEKLFNVCTFVERRKYVLIMAQRVSHKNKGFLFIHGDTRLVLVEPAIFGTCLKHRISIPSSGVGGRCFLYIKSLK